MHDRRRFIGQASRWMAGATTARFAFEGIPLLAMNRKPEKLEAKINDRILTAQDVKWSLLIKKGDKINRRGETFGDCADFTIFIPGKAEDAGFLWVNHESVNLPILYGEDYASIKKTKSMVDTERKLVGGSFLELKKNSQGQWQINDNSEIAFRVNALTKIEMDGPAGGRTAEGMVGNCCGGQTPWGTILTCEENVENFYGSKDRFGWRRYYDNSPLDYGWVVEIDPFAHSLRKCTALGRFAHEGAFCTTSKNGHLVVYMGDDSNDEHLYKYVSSDPISESKTAQNRLLNNGTLYVADLSHQQWLPLSPENKILQQHSSGKFKSLKDILINTRLAAKAVQATPLNRPEGIVFVKEKGRVLVSLTNNSEKKDYYGSILYLDEEFGDPGSLKFTHGTWISGGSEAGFACPDNLALDSKNGIWMTTDIDGSSLGRGVYSEFKANSLFKLSESPSNTVSAKFIASAPHAAELTGMSFEPSGENMFVSVQHPGEDSFLSENTLTSHWPEGSGSLPKSAVICLRSTKGTIV